MDLICARCLLDGAEQEAVTIRDGSALCWKHARQRRGRRLDVKIDNSPVRQEEAR